MVRWLSFVAWMVSVLALAGCGGPSRAEREVWDDLDFPTLGAIAPSGEAMPTAKFLGTVHMDIFVTEIPAENVEKLGPLWRVLSAQSVYLTSYNAFAQNAFRVKFGRIETWEQIQKHLTEAGAQTPARFSMPIADNDTSDLPIADFATSRSITYVGTDLSSQVAHVGPGQFVLRLRAEQVPGARGARKIIAYPTYVPPSSGALAQLSEIVRKREVYFAPAALAVVMSPGDLLVLGPDSYTGERLSLGGLFFSNPEGRLFVDQTKPTPPQVKPAARVYIIECKSITD